MEQQIAQDSEELTRVQAELDALQGGRASGIAPPALTVEQWVATAAAQALVGKTLKELREQFAAACPQGTISVDHPGGPKKKRGRSADRLIVNATGCVDSSKVMRVWGHFPRSVTHPHS